MLILHYHDMAFSDVRDGRDRLRIWEVVPNIVADSQQGTILQLGCWAIG
jgi:hypothetical protein